MFELSIRYRHSSLRVKSGNMHSRMQYQIDMNDWMSSRDLPVDVFSENLEKGAFTLLGGRKDKHGSFSLNLLDLWFLASILEDCCKAASN